MIKTRLKYHSLLVNRLHSGRPTVNLSNGFTIVELLVVIVVIGILAAITIVSFSGVRERANIATLQSDLKNASIQLESYKISSNDEVYPLDKSIAGIKSSTGTSLAYLRSSDTSYCLQGTNNSIVYHVDSTDHTVTSGACPADANWLIIGTQIWAKKNLNIGTMIVGASEQTNNSIIEKYCFNNDEANCTSHAALYQWDEAMQYTTTEGTQGICPAGSHIPSDNDWKILEMQLGMTQAHADSARYFNRGTDQSVQMRPGGSSGLELSLAGHRSGDAIFEYDMNSSAYLWSSTEYDTNSAWFRYLNTSETAVARSYLGKDFYGFSVRCLRD